MTDRPPEGYVDPHIVWCVETEIRAPDGELDHVVQLGAFSSEDEAQKLLNQLEGEGRFERLYLNMIAVHQRVDDWEWDR